MVNELNKYEEEDIEEVKKIVNNFNDYRQVEAIYNYCFKILNESDYFNEK